MAVDPTTIELAARIDRLNKRIERLETLEYGTAAFPTGGGAIICNFKLAAPSTIVICTFPATSFRHLIAIVACAQGSFTPGKMGVQFDSALSRYEFYAREENFLGVGVGVADTELTALVGTTVMATTHPSARDDPALDREQNAMMMVVADADKAGSPVFSQAWIGYSKAVGIRPGPLVEEEFVQMGGGFYNQLPLGGPIGSVKFITGAPGFIAGSRFTVYGL